MIRLPEFRDTPALVAGIADDIMAIAGQRHGCGIVGLAIEIDDKARDMSEERWRSLEAQFVGEDATPLLRQAV